MTGSLKPRDQLDVCQQCYLAPACAGRDAQAWPANRPCKFVRVQSKEYIRHFFDICMIKSGFYPGSGGLQFVPSRSNAGHDGTPPRHQCTLKQQLNSGSNPKIPDKSKTHFPEALQHSEPGQGSRRPTLQSLGRRESGLFFEGCRGSIEADLLHRPHRLLLRAEQVGRQSAFARDTRRSPCQCDSRGFSILLVGFP